MRKQFILPRRSQERAVTIATEKVVQAKRGQTNPLIKQPHPVGRRAAR
jgi:hypothetical protein